MTSLFPKNRHECSAVIITIHTRLFTIIVSYHSQMQGRIVISCREVILDNSVRHKAIIGFI